VIKVTRLKTQARYKKLAEAYYAKGLTMAQISDQYNVSQATVVRAIKWARNNHSVIRKLLPIHLKKNLDKNLNRIPPALRKPEALRDLRSLLSEV